MLDPYRLSLRVQTASGGVYRWGPDEPNGRDVPLDLEFTTSLPGGFKDLNCSLLRHIRSANPDNNLLDSVLLTGPGGVSAFEGFFSQFPRRHGAQFSIDPGALGWSAVLGFFPGFERIYIDRDSSAWGTIPIAQRAAVAATQVFDSDYSVQNGNGLVFNGVDGKAISINSQTGAWYQAPPGCLVSKLAYIGTEANTTNVEAAQLFPFSDEVTADTGLALTLDNTLRTASLVTARRFLKLRAAATATHTPAAGVPFRRIFSALAAYGNHGLTTRAIDATTPDGLYNCDIVADILAQTVAGILNWTTGSGGSIEPNTTLVAHLAFKDPVTAMDALAKASGFGIAPFLLPEWGVYDDRTFFWRSPDSSRLCWQARMGDGAKPVYEGEQSDDQVNGVLVSFTDPAGVRRVVGPPAQYWPTGVALADSTDTTLVDASAANNVNAHNVGPKWARLDLSQPATTAGAIALGAIYLAIMSQPQRRGSIELTGLVGHPTISQGQPVYRVRAGDWIQLTDSENPSLRRRIVSTRYSHAGRSLVADVDNRPFTLDALLEVLQADQVGLFFG